MRNNFTEAESRPWPALSALLGILSIRWRSPCTVAAIRLDTESQHRSLLSISGMPGGRGFEFHGSLRVLVETSEGFLYLRTKAGRAARM